MTNKQLLDELHMEYKRALGVTTLLDALITRHARAVSRLENIEKEAETYLAEDATVKEYYNGMTRILNAAKQGLGDI